MNRWQRYLPAGFSAVGLTVGLLFLCGSLTPSLLPRHPIAQGLLSGISVAVGYCLSVIGLAIYRFLELRQWEGRSAIIARRCVLGFCCIPVAVTLDRMAYWQNSIRALMDMPPIDSGYPVTVLAVAILTALILILLARLLAILIGRLAHWLQKLMPPRVALVTSYVMTILLLISLVNGMVVKRLVGMMDHAFAAIDQAIDEGMEPPRLPFSSGGDDSLIQWDDIGRNGKRFLINGPAREQISELTGRPALEPIRVYAGYNTGETLQERASITLNELIRVGGFDRRVLVVATPTGTGWLDPSAIQTLPYMHDGDLAIVSMQYSYLPSWLTIAVDPDVSRRSAKALFSEVYSHWTTLPKESRPKLYLFGLSLGALGSEAALDLFELLGDPIDGAVLSGPPFPSRLWRQIVGNRKPGTPMWRPIFRDAELVRFMNQQGVATPPHAKWGVLRTIYIQHASDPMVFFSPSLAYSKPDWLGEQRGPDVSPAFRWFPLVTFLQVGFDVPMATAAPLGYAHSYAPNEYIDAFIEVTQPQDWSEEDTAALKLRFADFNPSPI